MHLGNTTNKISYILELIGVLLKTFSLSHSEAFSFITLTMVSNML